ncbi:DUF4214 domain-containing protein [Massilia sp. YIM B04103]|uniref:DUF4214 domain-containing protein n=1 Tax=Massilia sp. YIM B04103 TaxID=2963106 RepID=UPI00210B84FF|nr:DUF4214 domain-containing protein [Massilia sp. YIM B04103]
MASADDAVVSYTYDKRGLLISQTDALGFVTTMHYDAFGQLDSRTTQIKDGRTVTETLAYNHRGQLTDTVSDSDGAKLSVHTDYDAFGRPEKRRDANGNVTSYGYDKLGRQVSVQLPLGPATTATYDAFDRVLTQTDANGQTTRTEYNTQQRTVTLTTPEGFKKVVRNNRYGQQVELTDGNSNTTIFKYNRDGKLEATVNALNEEVKNAYDQAGRLWRSTDANGTVTEFTYDAANRILSKTIDANGPLKLSTKYSYDALGQVQTVTDPRGIVTSNVYDKKGQLKSVIVDNNGAKLETKFEYDGRGKTLSVTDPAGRVTIYEYDNLGRRTVEVVDPKSRNPKGLDLRTEYEYDSNGNVIARKDANQYLSRFAYDKNNRLSAKIDGAGAVTEYIFDAAGRILTTTAHAKTLDLQKFTPSGNTIADTAALLKTVASLPETDQVLRNVYNADGQVAYTVDGIGAVKKLVYDRNGNITESIAYATKISLSNLGDNPSATDIAGRIATDGSDQMQRVVYDAANRSIASATAQRLLESGMREWAIISNEYDSNGNLTAQRRYSTVIQGVIAPLPNDIKTFIANPANQSATDAAKRYVYDRANRQVAIATALGENSQGSLEWAVVAQTYDKAGNQSMRTEFAQTLSTNTLSPNPDMGAYARWIQNIAPSNDDRISRFGYDSANRLVVSIDAAGAATRLELDKSGNVLSRTRHASMAGFLPPSIGLEEALKLIAADPEQDRIERNEFDAAGRLRFSLDAEGYIKEQRYDGLGRVSTVVLYTQPAKGASNIAAAAKKPGAKFYTTTFSYNPQGHVISNTDALGLSEYYRYDALGNKVGFTNKLNQTWQYTYDSASRLVLEISPKVLVYKDGVNATMGNWGTGTLTEITTALEHDALGNLTKRVEATNIKGQERVTNYKYDSTGRQIQTIKPSSLIYDSGSDPRNAYQRGGPYEKASGDITITVLYDALGNAVRNIDAAGQSSYKIYDRRGHVIYEIDAKGYVTGYQRNAFGEVTLTIRYSTPWNSASTAPLSSLDANQFAAGLSRNAANDRTLASSYDARGQIRRVSEAVLNIYDRNSQRDTLYLDAGKVTERAYNAFGEMHQQLVYGADAAGNQLTVAAETALYYDLRGNKKAEVVKVADANGERSGYLTCYEYDAAGNLARKSEFSTAVQNWDNRQYAVAPSLASDRITVYEYDGNNRLSSESKLNTSYARISAGGAPETVSGTLTTLYGYDAVGNRTSVTSPLNAVSYSYYDALGRQVASADFKAQDASSKAPLTELKLDAHGNTLLRIDYADGCPAKATASSAGEISQAMQCNADNRVTAYSYDVSGRLIRTIDAEQFSRAPEKRSALVLSYDVLGRVARQSREVSDHYGNILQSFQINRYDELGRVIETESPGNINLISQKSISNLLRRYAYNAFGEIETISYIDDKGEHIQERNKYDRAGRLWQSNAGDGVDKVMLFDAQGNVTAQIASTSAQASPFAQLTDSKAVLAMRQLQRTESRYDLMGRKIDERLAIDSQVQFVVRDAASGSWIKQSAASDAPIGERLLLVGATEDKGKNIRVLYRLNGSQQWIDESAVRVTRLGEHADFNMAGMAAGTYQYKVIVQPAGEAAYERSSGTLQLQEVSTREPQIQLARIYSVLLDRAPDLAGLNHYIELLNQGHRLAELVTHFIGSKEAESRLSGSSEQIIRSLLRDAFGRTGLNDPAYANDLTLWTDRYETARKASDGSLGQVVLDLIDSIANYKGQDGAMLNAQRRLGNRVEAGLQYVLDFRGNDKATAAAIYARAESDLAGAKEQAKSAGADELRRNQIAQIYLVLFSRAPEKIGMEAWLKALQHISIEAAAEGILNSIEAKDALLYPSEGLSTSEYRQQLVRRAYQHALGRVPNATEESRWLASIEADQDKLGNVYGRFIISLAEEISSYGGSDSARQAEKQLFNNRLNVALRFSQQDLTGAPETDFRLIARSATLAVTSDGAVKTAADMAVNFAAAAALVADSVSKATNAAAAAVPLEDTRLQLARLYAALLNRTPDSSGFDFQISNLANTSQTPPTAAQWHQLVSSLLTGAEAQRDPSLLSDPNLTATQFVERIYSIALGKVPTSAAAQREIAVFAEQLRNKSRSEVAWNVVNGMLGFKELSAEERSMKALFDNKAAVGLACAINLGPFGWANEGKIQQGRKALSLVSATDVNTALSYAYAESQMAFKATSASLIEAAGKAASSMLDAAQAGAALVEAQAALKAAEAAAAAQPTAAARLALMQMYVGLLGRDESSFKKNPDLKGFNFQIDLSSTRGMELLAQGIIDSDEGKGIYGRIDSNEGFVQKIFATIFNGAQPTQALIASWAKKLGGATPLSRGQIAWGILESVISFTVPVPDTDAPLYQQARPQLSARVANCLAAMSVAQDAAVVSAAAQLASLQNLKTGLEQDAQTKANDLKAKTDVASATQKKAIDALNAANNLGDGSAEKRLTINRLYATLLKRTAPPRLDEVAAHLNTRLDAVAQSMMTLPEAGSSFPVDNASFVAELYRRILGREPNAGDDLSLWTRKLTADSSPYARGSIALEILNSYVTSYTDSKSEELGNKVAFDRKIDSFLAAQHNAARENYLKEKEIADRLTIDVQTAQRNYLDAQNNTRAKERIQADSETKAARGQILVTRASSLRQATAVYLGLRGYTDIDGIITQVEVMNRPVAPQDIYYVIDELRRANDYPVEPRSYVAMLYNKVLGRNATEAEITHWTSKAATHAQVAYDIITSAEGERRWAAQISSDCASSTATVQGWSQIATVDRRASEEARRDERSKFEIYERLNTSSRDANTRASTAGTINGSTSAIANAHTLVAPATQAKKELELARSAYQDAKAKLDAYPVDLLKSQTESKDAQRHAAGDRAGLQLAQATAQMNKAQAQLATASTAGAATPLQRFSTQTAHLYMTLLNRPPLLVEMQFWVGKLSNGMSLSAAANVLLSTREAIILYPAGQSDSAFVTQLFLFGLGRNFERDPNGLEFWSKKLSGSQAKSRADVIEEFISSIPRNGNDDTAIFAQRAARNLQAVVTEASSPAGANLLPSIQLAAEAARNEALRYDSAGVNRLAGVPNGQYIKPLVQLYVALLDRAPDAPGISSWIATMSRANSSTLQEVADGFIESQEGRVLYPQGISDHDFMQQVMTRVLGRVPTESEINAYTQQMPRKSRGQSVLDLIATATNTSGGDLQQMAVRSVFELQLTGALRQLAADAARDAMVANAALAALKQIANTNPVDVHTEKPVPAIGIVLQAAEQIDRSPATLTLDRWGNVLAIADRRDPNWKINYSYNHNNQQLIKTANTLEGQSVSFIQSFYDAQDRLIANIDANKNISKFSYDANGNVETEIHADGGIVQNTYNVFGNRTSMLQPLSGGNVVLTRYAYDHMGRLVSLGTSSADPQRLISVYSASLDYATNPDFFARVSFSGELKESHVYDELGRKISSTNANNETTKFEYDLDGNQTVSINALGYRTFTAYDALRRRIASQDANGERMSWEYDSAGRLSTHFDLGGGKISYTYNAAGQKIEQLTERGNEKGAIRYIYTDGRVSRIIDEVSGMATTYTYDAVGNRLSEVQEHSRLDNLPLRRQNNKLSYDMQNRLETVQDDLYTLSYTYDLNGNRKTIRTQFGSQDFTVYNEYDSMNRQTLVNGELDKDSGQLVIGKSGHRLSYDLAGNRLSDTFRGSRVDKYIGGYTITENQTVTESYTYDAVGRLDTTTRDGVLRIETRHYDAVGRIIESGFLGSYDSTNGNVEDMASKLGTEALTTTYHYDAAGHLERQKSRRLDGVMRRETYFVPDGGNPTGGYDAVGNLLGYTTLEQNGSKNIYTISYNKFDSYKEGQIRLRDGATHTSDYDVHGNRTKVRDGSKPLIHLWYDADGHVQSKEDRDTPSFNLIVNGEVLGVESEKTEDVLGTIYTGVSSPALKAAPSSYSVQSGNETLQTIAQAVWGDSKLWYLIADANSLEINSKLKVGDILNIPLRANTVHNDYSTFRPYDAAEAVGNTTPMPVPKHGGKCGGVGQLVMIVVAVVVTYFTAGALGGVMGQVIGAAAGSVASQAAGMAMGIQDKFSWKSVALAAVSAGVTQGVGSMVEGSWLANSGWQAAAGRAVISNVVSQGIGNITGLQSGFNWRSVAVAGVGAAVSTSVNEELGLNVNGREVAGLNPVDKLFKQTMSGLASGTAAAIARGGKISVTQIATDAFGNALGNSIGETLHPTSMSDRRMTDRSDEIARKAKPTAQREMIEFDLPESTRSSQTSADALARLQALPEISSKEDLEYADNSFFDTPAGKDVLERGGKLGYGLQNSSYSSISQGNTRPTADVLRMKENEQREMARQLSKHADWAFDQGEDVAGKAYRKAAIEANYAAAAYSKSAMDVSAETQKIARAEAKFSTHSSLFDKNWNTGDYSAGIPKGATKFPDGNYGIGYYSILGMEVEVGVADNEITDVKFGMGFGVGGHINLATRSIGSEIIKGPVTGWKKDINYLQFGNTQMPNDYRIGVGSGFGLGFGPIGVEYAGSTGIYINRNGGGGGFIEAKPSIVVSPAFQPKLQAEAKFNLFETSFKRK